MNIAPDLLPVSTRDKGVVAFDGDDTLWVDSTDEQQWERHFKHLAVDRLPCRDMAPVFQARLKRDGLTIKGVRDALLAAARESCAASPPNEWMEQVQALPDIAGALKIEPAEGLNKALTALGLSGAALWIITKGDLIRQAIKLCAVRKVVPFLQT
jgi:FMN phosphatase YigB (HAD superfamily)